VKIRISIFSILFFLAINNQTATSATQTLYAYAKVLRAISLTKTTDLDFGEGFQGDLAKLVDPGTPSAAALKVYGEPNRAYQIVLPANPILMTTGNGGSTQTIEVRNFEHNAGKSPKLDGVGSAVFGVGATRGALLANQAPGNYIGVFKVTVSY
jgi:hypothetical protein